MNYELTPLLLEVCVGTPLHDVPLAHHVYGVRRGYGTLMVCHHEHCSVLRERLSQRGFTADVAVAVLSARSGALFDGKLQLQP